MAILVQPPQPSETARPGEASSAEEADLQGSERSVATLLTGTGPSWELHGPRKLPAGCALQLPERAECY
ncbi:TPA: hypothetical protein ACH3X2_010560 [Trebouxia sp. C0005]